MSGLDLRRQFSQKTPAGPFRFIRTARPLWRLACLLLMSFSQYIRLLGNGGVAGKDIGVKKYVVRPSADERVRLEEFIRKGGLAAHLVTSARILLKMDVSEAGEGWSDSRIAEALDAGDATVERTR